MRENIITAIIFGALISAAYLGWRALDHSDRRARIEQLRGRVQANIENSDAALAEMRALVQAQRESDCEHLITSIPKYARCMDIPVVRWCDLSSADRDAFASMGTPGPMCVEDD